MVEDLINQCSYQMIEDEDHVQLGGVAHFKDFTLPFVYINGYKYTPLRDALTLFSPECCISACTIPRSVLQKHKAIVKTFSTWEQVYKLELIKMKKGPAIMTGDMLLKLDTLLTLLPELIQQIVELHIGTKLKRSKTCDINAYKILKSTFM
ncbi:uncharacterized protein LOC123540876 [Mercenaria mercenaria]|uniref:uncharacterized protein LOC123540876 n=1 Tax=Mercenaria mercenaria TaxID=6596 RepID=UPI00234F51CA|nr:uncharacterized protein LOC123540876 [Mercenaria mercenaria]